MRTPSTSDTMTSIPEADSFFNRYDLSVEEQEFAQKLVNAYPDIAAWVNQNSSTSLTCRINFIRALNFASPKTDKAKVDLKTLLGENFNLYEAAMQEEFASPEFRFCIIAKAFKKYHGDTQGKVPIIPLGGPSGAGKSTSAAQLVARYIPENRDHPDRNHDFAMAFVDGGIPREQNNMQKILKRYAELHGLRLSKFQHPTKALSKLMSGVKDKIRELGYAAAAGTFTPLTAPPVGVVEVETFSGDAVKGQKKISKIIIQQWEKLTRPLNVIMGIVGGDDPGVHPQDVRKMATYRSDPSDEFLARMKQEKTKYLWGDHAYAIPELKEYKPYGKHGYMSGVTGSWKAALKFWNYQQSKTKQIDFKLVVVENPVKPYQKDSGTPWRKGEEMQVASPKVAAEASRRMKLPGNTKKFSEHCRDLWKDKAYSTLRMVEVSEQQPSFQKLTALLKKQMHFKTKDSLQKTLWISIERGFKKILKKFDKLTFGCLHNFVSSMKYRWAQGNIPYTIQALDIGRMVNMKDYDSVVNAEQQMAKIIAQKQASRNAWQRLWSFRSKLEPVLQEIHRELKRSTYQLSKYDKVYHAQALAKTVEKSAEGLFDREIYLQLALMTVYCTQVAQMMPAAFVDYAFQNYHHIHHELKYNINTRLSLTLVDCETTPYHPSRLFQQFQDHLARDYRVSAILKHGT